MENFLKIVKRASLFNRDLRVNGLDWQCCLAGSSKTTPQDFDFFNCHGGVAYSFELNSIETYAPIFLDIIICSSNSTTELTLIIHVVAGPIKSPF